MKHSLVVDSLKLLSMIFPRLTRDQLKYKFDQCGEEFWQDYEREYCAVLGEDRWKELVNEMETFSKEMLRAGKKKIVILNATFFGGGVAEMIPGLHKFLKRFGIEVEWQIIRPRCPAKFYGITKKIHNIIQGQDADFSERDIAVLDRIGWDNFCIYRSWLHDREIGVIFFEDPQVISTLKYFMEYAKKTKRPLPAVFRLHIDISGIKDAKENSGARWVWDYINGIILRFHNEFGGVLLFQPYLNPWEGLERAFQQPPGIDILSEKNRPITNEELRGILTQLKEKEILSRDLNELLEKRYEIIVSGARADLWKGLLQTALAYLELAKDYKCKLEDKRFPRLVLFAGGADDDPETRKVRPQLESVVRKHNDLLYFVWNARGREVGALYCLSARTFSPVVIASVREGYNLVIDEAIRQGALPITTNAGGLKRFEQGVEVGYRWLIRLDEAEFRRVQPEDLTNPESVVSQILVRKIKEKLLEFYNTCSKEEYVSMVQALQGQVFSTSLLPMARDYLKWTVKYVRTNW